MNEGRFPSTTFPLEMGRSLGDLEMLPPWIQTKILTWGLETWTSRICDIEHNKGHQRRAKDECPGRMDEDWGLIDAVMAAQNIPRLVRSNGKIRGSQSSSA
jgi:hypothetical protein